MSLRMVRRGYTRPVPETPIGPHPRLPPTVQPSDPGAVEPPVPVGSTIGILGGGQLGRMLGFAARELGYRVAILDPDPDCPARAVADRQVVAAYADALAERLSRGRRGPGSSPCRHAQLGGLSSTGTYGPTERDRRALPTTEPTGRTIARVRMKPAP